jgi:hypothetical protein
VRGQDPPPSPFPLLDWRSPFQLVALGRGNPSTWPQTSPPPNTDGQLRSQWMGDENCGGGGVRVQAPPSLMGSLYRNTDEVTAIYNRLVKSLPIWCAIITRLLLRRLISLRAFSYDAKFHCNPLPMAHSFIPRILLRRLISLSAFSYGT